MTDNALLRLKSLQFEGAGSYREETPLIHLANQGRVLIHGHEGAGKTMIPEVLTLIFHGKGSPRMRTTGLVESTIVNKETGYKGTVSFDSGFGSSSRSVEITQAFKHKKLKSKYIITVDGVHEEPDGKPQQRKMVTRLVPLSMGEWLGVVYLSQGAVHDLLAGTPTAKREYLTSVFGLDFYDDLNEVAKDELKALKGGALSSLDLEQRREDLLEDVKQNTNAFELISKNIGIPEGQIEESLTDRSNEIKSISKRIGSVGSILMQMEKMASLQEELSRLLIDGGGDNVEETEGLISGVKEKTKALVSRLTDATSQLKTIKRHQAMYDKAKGQVDSLRKVMRSRKSERIAAKEACDKYTESGLADNIAKDARDALLTISTAISGDISLHKDPDHSADKPWRDYVDKVNAINDSIKNMNRLKNKFSGHAECPTCHQSVDIAAIDDSIESLTNNRDEVAKSVPHAVSAHLLAIDDSWVGGSIATVSDLCEHYECAVEAFSDLREAKKSYKEDFARYNDAKAEFEELEAPEPADKIKERVDKLSDERDELDDEVDHMHEVLVAQQKISSLGEASSNDTKEDLESRLEKLKKKQTRKQNEYDGLRSSQSKIEHHKTMVQSLEKQVSQVDKKIEEHAELAVKIKTYESDIIPHFSALRASKVRSCVSVLEGILPVYVNAMSTNQYIGSEVKTDISEDLKKVDILLKNGKNSDWVSAVQSSGGQRRGFTLAMCAALREVSPRKSNVMFFDEPFADLQGDRKLAFVNRLIPLMMDRCPDLESVFVIAHDQEVLEAGADTFDHRWEAVRGPDGSHINM